MSCSVDSFTDFSILHYLIIEKEIILKPQTSEDPTYYANTFRNSFILYALKNHVYGRVV